nr:serine hydrolase domain-containing protein [Streptomyces spiramenti]
MEAAVTVADAPDVVVGWARHGERVIRSGGTAEPPPLPREKLRYEIGSASKTFNTLLLSTLVADGTLSWCTPAAALLAAGRRPDSRRPDASVLHLATHTAGLPRLPADFYPRAVPRWATNPYADYPAERVIDAFLRAPLRRRAPGSRWRYSNFGASVLGHALAAHAGLPWEHLLRERVLAPLALAGTALAPGGVGGAAPYRPAEPERGVDEHRGALASALAGDPDRGGAATGPMGSGGPGAAHRRDSGDRRAGSTGPARAPGGAPPTAPPEDPGRAARHGPAAPGSTRTGTPGTAGPGWDAVGHGRDGLTRVPPLLMGGFAPAGAVRATPHDLLAFLEAQLEPERTPLEGALRALRGPVLRRGFGHRHTHTASWFHRPGDRGPVLFHAGATSGQQALLAFRPATGTAMVALSTRRFRATDPFPRVVHALIDDLP